MLECWGGGFGRHHTTDIWDEIPLCYVALYGEIEGEAVTFGVQIVVILFFK